MKSKIKKISDVLAIIISIVGVIVLFIELTNSLDFFSELIGIVLLVLIGFIVGLFSSFIAKQIKKISPTSRIFISYSYRDKELASEIKNALRSSGIKVWDYDEKVLPGQDWHMLIDSALSNTDKMITILPDIPTKSMSYEIKNAMTKNIPIIPVITKEINLPASLKSVQYLDLSKDKQEGIIKLIKTLS